MLIKNLVAKLMSYYHLIFLSLILKRKVQKCPFTNIFAKNVEQSLNIYIKD